MAAKKQLGITVLPEYIQCETVPGVLDRLEAIGANCVTTSPYVMATADAETGQREPPADAGRGPWFEQQVRKLSDHARPLGSTGL